ncbi:MAG TPA: hypothetical protein VG186_12425 [Solirubrobacteraceae bacterium]|nr:hypothetical protein [Solirubrobacteraceae bacterium]
MNPRDLFGMIEPVLADVRSKVTPLLSFSFEEAKRRHAEAGPVTRIASGLAAGMVAGKVVTSLAR